MFNNNSRFVSSTKPLKLHSTYLWLFVNRAAKFFIFWAADFVDWAAKLGSRFYFFRQLNSFQTLEK
jgi:hypothetical protein